MTETNHTMFGVEGTLTSLYKPGEKTFVKQLWISTPRRSEEEIGRPCALRVQVRYDDGCRNGHNAFSITFTGKELTRPGELGGVDPDLIAKVFPELKTLLKWNGCTSEGPVHYVGNTLYHAGDRDHNGLREGEKRQIINGRTGKPSWELVTEDGQRPRSVKDTANADECPTEVPKLVWRPWCLVGEGKERDLDAARRSAAWPDATDDELCQDREALKAQLESRLPQLLKDFEKAVRDAGLAWEPKEAS